MSKSVDLITEEDIKSMIEDCDTCTHGEPAKPVTIDELAEACEKAAPLYMEPLKEYLQEKEEGNVQKR